MFYMFRYSFIAITMLLTSSCFAQTSLPARDTSFTVYSTWIKEKKKRSYIIIAAPAQPKEVASALDVPYKPVNGRDLLLDVFYPRKTKKAKPAVLLIFGGGWRSGDKSQNHAMAIELAKNGYVAVSADYRLSTEATYPAAVYDLKTAVKWMKTNAKKYGIDTNHIATLGCSAGGQLAALIGTTNHDLHFEDTTEHIKSSATVHAVVDIDGTLAFHHPESVEGTAAAQWLGGTYEQAPITWQEAAPLEHADSSTVPFLFVNSSIPRFHAGRDDMIRKLDAFHIYSEVHTLDDTPHPFWFFHPWFDPMMNYIITFLNRQFK
jgi:acetyl esterase/lipase